VRLQGHDGNRELGHGMHVLGEMLNQVLSVLGELRALMKSLRETCLAEPRDVN
jgi:hypothetical protein